MLLEENISVIHMIAFLYRKQSTYLNDKLKEYGLNAGLYPVLITIYKNEDLIQEEIAKRIGLTKSTITRNLKKLENKGFIKRIPNKRTKIIKITEKGKITVKKIMDLDEKWDEKIIEIIGKNEYNNFLNDLQKISEELIGIEVFKT